MALTSSFGTLQISLSNVRMQTQSLISDCNSAAAVMSQLRATCDSIPRADDLQTEANFNNVSDSQQQMLFFTDYSESVHHVSTCVYVWEG